MPKKLREKVKAGFMVLAIVFSGNNLIAPVEAQADECLDLKIIFARGSGAEKDNDDNYLEFKSRLLPKLMTTGLKYDFEDLDYPAIGIGIDNLVVTARAYLGAGDSYEFGESVDTGVRSLLRTTANTLCQNTKYIIGGYSQGAMVISKALRNLDADKIIYVATFGDPKIYLPEGEGINPAACRGENLSDYRAYVPDCQAYKGLLGAYTPYEPETFSGKVGTWCNKEDIFCSSYLNIDDHISYISDSLYEDASRVIFDKIIKYFDLENRVLSPHDTVFLLDSTESMESMIDAYKSEALRLATETLASGGRIALFDYRDLADPYEPVKHCDFENCTLEKFQTELVAIETDGGGDIPESMLSAAKYAMLNLNWQVGATKSLVVLTEADFISPDRDGTTIDEVVALSQAIDPVNVYVITQPGYATPYLSMAAATGGKVVTNFAKLDELTDYIMERYDSLPKVEENIADTLPTLKIKDLQRLSDAEIEINFETTGTRTLVILNDAIIGLVEGESFVIGELNNNIMNVVTLVPFSERRRGMAMNIAIEEVDGRGSATINDVISVPKAPNTGIADWQKR